jgi:hypothetical protein
VVVAKPRALVGYIAATVAAFIFGVNGVVIKLLMDGTGIDGFQVTFLRVVGAAVGDGRADPLGERPRLGPEQARDAAHQSASARWMGRWGQVAFSWRWKVDREEAVLAWSEIHRRSPCAKRSRRGRSVAIAAMALAMDWGSLPTNCPVLSSSTYCCGPPQRVLTTGVAQAMASKAAMQSPS